MFPKWHILTGFVVSYLLVYFFDVSILAGAVIFLSSVLIDFDHYLLYFFKTGSLNLASAYNHFARLDEKWIAMSAKDRGRYKKSIYAFHGVECWLVLAALSFLSPIFAWILAGIAIHIVADWAEILYYGGPLYLKISTIYTYVKNKNKKELR